MKNYSGNVETEWSNSLAADVKQAEHFGDSWIRAVF